MKWISFLVVGLLLLAGCGPNKLEPVEKKAKEPKVCPQIDRPPTEEISFVITTQMARLPLVLEVNGEKRVSDCENFPAKNPVVQLWRNNNNMLVKIQHFDKLEPTKVTLTLRARSAGCGDVAEIDVVPTKEIELPYRTEFPDGGDCPGARVARVNL